MCSTYLCFEAIVGMLAKLFFGNSSTVSSGNLWECMVQLSRTTVLIRLRLSQIFALFLGITYFGGARDQNYQRYPLSHTWLRSVSGPSYRCIEQVLVVSEVVCTYIFAV